MTKKGSKQNKKNSKSKVNPESPWLKMRTGLLIVSIVSIGIGAFMGWAVYQIDKNIMEGLLWGLGFGGAIWGIFFIAFYFNRAVRGKRD
jgi:hypothetical protein